jgi:3,4-dihydroxy-9,10-secoandrosta-1,3,5(10)-triene-9,17-dione 4,5-dioxygenase
MGVIGQGYVVIEASDPAAWGAFLTGVVGAMAAGDGCYRVDERLFRFRIESSANDRLAATGLLVSPGALDNLAARIEASGQAVNWASQTEAAARGAARLFCTTDPAGYPLEFYEGDAAASAPFASPAGISRFVTGKLGLGHSVFAAPDFDPSHRFYRETVGLGESDLPVMELFGPEGPKTHAAFLHGEGGRHHCIALIEMPPSPAQCIHLMVELETLDEVGKAYDRALAGGCPISATLGRHWNDGVASFYVQTPGGFDLEIGCDGVVVGPEWQVTAHNDVSVWGHEWAWQKAMKEAQA